MRESRVPYLEAREACELEERELKVVREQIGAEIREASGRGPARAIWQLLYIVATYRTQFTPILDE